MEFAGHFDRDGKALKRTLAGLLNFINQALKLYKAVYPRAHTVNYRFSELRKSSVDDALRLALAHIL